MGEFSLRPAEAGDIPAIASIYRANVLAETASFEEMPPTDTEMERRRSLLLGTGYPYLVAISDAGELAGYCYASAYRDRPAYRTTVEDSVYVHPNYYRQGLGQRLLSALIEACEASGFRQMIAVIGDSGSRDHSVALHRRCGFEPAGNLKAVGFKHDQWCDTLLMQRELGLGRQSAPTGL